GTEPVVGGRVAPPGDTADTQSLDIGLMDGVVVIDERAFGGGGRVVASDPAGTEGKRVEMDLVVANRGVTAVVDVEPEAVDVEVPFVGAPERQTRPFEGRLAIDPAPERSVVGPGRVEVDMTLDAIPLAVVEQSDLVVPHPDVATVGGRVEVIDVEAQERLVVGTVGRGVGQAGVVAGEPHPGRPTRRSGGGAAVAQAVVGVQVGRPGPLPAVGRLDVEAVGEAD